MIGTISRGVLHIIGILFCAARKRGIRQQRCRVWRRAARLRCAPRITSRIASPLITLRTASDARACA